jgi:hypothetical protein
VKPRRNARTGRLRTTIPVSTPPPRRSSPRPPKTDRPRSPKGSAPPARAPRHLVARIVETSDKSLADVIDSLLNKGVVLNADLILALANVDLIYVRLCALICAADRLAPVQGTR